MHEAYPPGLEELSTHGAIVAAERVDPRAPAAAAKMHSMLTVTIYAILRPDEDLVQTLAGVCRGLADALGEPVDTINARFLSVEAAVAGEYAQGRFDQRPWFEIVGPSQPPASVEPALRAVAAAVAVGVGVWPDHVSGRYVTPPSGSMVVDGDIV
jgi:hypothetical protein